MDATFTLQLIGVVALGSFTGEFRRSTNPTEFVEMSFLSFFGSMLGNAFLSFWVAYATYEIFGNRVFSLSTGGLLSYQEEALIMKYSHGFLERASAAWKAFNEIGGDKD